ncbi:MAG: hypothetical protein WB507_10610 [Solirubrobacterales bacterium]
MGGALGATEPRKVTEGVINKAAGPESTIGHTVGESVAAAGGLLGLHR